MAHTCAQHLVAVRRNEFHPAFEPVWTQSVKAHPVPTRLGMPALGRCLWCDMPAMVLPQGGYALWCSRDCARVAWESHPIKESDEQLGERKTPQRVSTRPLPFDSGELAVGRCLWCDLPALVLPQRVYSLWCGVDCFRLAWPRHPSNERVEQLEVEEVDNCMSTGGMSYPELDLKWQKCIMRASRGKSCSTRALHTSAIVPPSIGLELV